MNGLIYICILIVIVQGHFRAVSNQKINIPFYMDVNSLITNAFDLDSKHGTVAKAMKDLQQLAIATWICKNVFEE